MTSLSVLSMIFNNYNVHVTFSNTFQIWGDRYLDEL